MTMKNLKTTGEKAKWESKNKLEKSMYAEKKLGQKEQKVEAKDGKWEGRGGRNWEDSEWIIMAFLCEELEWVQSDVNNITVISLMSSCCTMIKIVQNGCTDQVIDWRIQTWMQRDPRFLDFRQSVTAKNFHWSLKKNFKFKIVLFYPASLRPLIIEEYLQKNGFNS